MASASTLREAIAEFDASPPDVILADIHLPDGDGLDLLRAVTRKPGEVDVIVMTGLDDVSLAAEAMKEGAYDFLAKPLQLSQVSAIVRRCLHEREVRSEAGISTSLLSMDLSSERVVGRTPQMVEVFKRVGMAASNRSPVLIRGETGTGKEVLARSIHRFASPSEPYVAVNCAALPDTLLESELFGHVRGAFTGAVSSKRGRFEVAGKGTIFLDEIGDTSPSFQNRILRVVQEKEITPLGSERTVNVPARILTATHRPLETLVEEGVFRADLYYRLRVMEIVLPPLRERRDDIPDLTRYFLMRAAQLLGRNIRGIDPAALNWLRAQEWPGNVRELENTVTRSMALARGSVLTLDDILAVSEGGTSAAAGAQAQSNSLDRTLDAVMIQHVHDVVEEAGGNKREACRRLGISPARLYRLLQLQEAGGGEESE